LRFTDRQCLPLKKELGQVKICTEAGKFCI